MTLHSPQSITRTTRYHRDARGQLLQVLVALAVLTMLWLTRPDTLPASTQTEGAHPAQRSLIAGSWAVSTEIER